MLSVADCGCRGHSRRSIQDRGMTICRVGIPFNYVRSSIGYGIDAVLLIAMVVMDRARCPATQCIIDRVDTDMVRISTDSLIFMCILGHPRNFVQRIQQTNCSPLADRRWRFAFRSANLRRFTTYLLGLRGIFLAYLRTLSLDETIRQPVA